MEDVDDLDEVWMSGDRTAGVHEDPRARHAGSLRRVERGNGLQNVCTPAAYCRLCCVPGHPIHEIGCARTTAGTPRHSHPDPHDALGGGGRSGDCRMSISHESNRSYE
jgi:hypothetical protein